MKRVCKVCGTVCFSADERHGTLRLSNLTKSMSGKYICRASNTAGSDSCSINLEVITCTSPHPSQTAAPSLPAPSVSQCCCVSQLPMQAWSQQPPWARWWDWSPWCCSSSFYWRGDRTRRRRCPMRSSESFGLYCSVFCFFSRADASEPEPGWHSLSIFNMFLKYFLMMEVT